MIIPKTNLFRTLEQVGAELMALADECTSSFNEHEDGKIRDSDVAKGLGDMRKLYRSSLDSFLAAQAFIETLDTRMKIFAKSIEQFEDHISRRALNYGLSLIPDEMLPRYSLLPQKHWRIRRFRRVMMSMRKIWSGHYLEIGQTPEQMVAITEGNRFDSLKAVIHGRGEVERSSAYVAWVRKRALHPMELIDQFYERSLDFILPLRLEELQIKGLGGKGKDSQRILDSVAMQSVRTLQIQDCYNPVWRTLERRHTPSLQNLVVDFVPGLDFGRDLIRCRLLKVRVDSLRGFLASANSLQYLVLTISGWHFDRDCDIPSLRALAVNFMPHPSFARHLTRFTLTWPHPKVLAGLLDFLSSAEMLQALSIYLNGGFDRVGASPANSRVVTLPHLASCEIHQGGFRFVEPILVHPLSARLRMPVLRRLELQFRSDFVGFDEVLKVLDDHPQDNFIVPLGRLIYFEGCRELTPNLVNTVAGILTDIDPVQIKFDDCRVEGWDV